MFDAQKKNSALEVLGSMCHGCGDKHSDECPLAKAIGAAKAIPVQE